MLPLTVHCIYETQAKYVLVTILGIGKYTNENTYTSLQTVFLFVCYESV